MFLYLGSVLLFKCFPKYNMEPSELDSKSDKLDKILESIETPMMGIKFNILRKIMDELESDSKVGEILGENPSTKLGIVANLNDLKIIDTQEVEMSEDGKVQLAATITEILEKNLAE